MKLIRILPLVALLVVSTSLASAQDGGRRQGGGGGGRMMGMRGGGMMMSPTMILQRDDVREDLALTDDQKAKLGSIQESVRTRMRDAFQSANGDRDAMRSAMETVMKDVQKEVDAVLTAEQKVRLREIFIQMQGPALLLTDKDLAKELKVTPAQKAKMEDLQKKADGARQTLFERMRNGEVDRDEMRTLMEKIQTTLKDEYDKILTVEQRDKLKALGGKEFKRVDRERGTR